MWLSADDEIVISHRDTGLPDDDLWPSLVPAADEPTPLVKDFYASQRNKFLIKEAWVHQKVDNKTYRSDDFTTPAIPWMYLPLLSEVLDAVCPTGKKIVVEMKGNDPRLGPRVVELLEKKNLFDCIHIFSTFQWEKYQNPEYETVADLLEPIKNEPRIERALLFNVYPTANTELLKAAKYYNAHAFHPSCVLLDDDNQWGTEFIKAAHSDNRVVSCYYGSDIDHEELLADKLNNYDLDEICTNNPDILSALIENNGSLPQHLQRPRITEIEAPWRKKKEGVTFKAL